jgi:hypothetical protein
MRLLYGFRIATGKHSADLSNGVDPLERRRFGLGHACFRNFGDLLERKTTACA